MIIRTSQESRHDERREEKRSEEENKTRRDDSVKLSDRGRITCKPSHHVYVDLVVMMSNSGSRK